MPPGTAIPSHQIKQAKRINAPHSVVPMAKKNSLRSLPDKSSAREPFIFLDGYRCDCHLQEGDVSEVDNSCKALRVSQLYVYTRFEEKFLVCASHAGLGGAIVPMSRFVAHLKKSPYHPIQHPTKVKHLTAMAIHVAERYGIDPEQSAESLLHVLPENINSPIPMVNLQAGPEATVMLCYRCPFTLPNGLQCKRWEQANRGTSGPSRQYINAHINKEHGKEHGEQCKKNIGKPRWVQRINMSVSSLKVTHPFILPENWEPSCAPAEGLDSLSPFSAPLTYHGASGDGIPVHQASWMLQLGWDTYLKSLREPKILALRDLISIPTEVRAQKFKGKKRWIEAGLLLLYKELTGYLKGGNEFLDGRQISVRNAVANFSNKSQYRDIKPNTIKKYRRPLIYTIGMMTRFILAVRTGKAEQYGGFMLVGVIGQAEAALALYSLIIDKKGKLSPEELQRPMHTLLDALLRPTQLSTNHIACPTDQMLFLFAVLPHGHYRTANSIQDLCAMLQYGFRTTILQEARQKLGAVADSDRLTCTSRSSPLNPKSEQEMGRGSGQDFESESSDVDEGYDDDNEDDEDENGSDEPDEELESDTDDNETDRDKVTDKDHHISDFMELPEGVTANSLTESIPQDQLMQFLKDEQQWLAPTASSGLATPFNRMRNVWYHTHRASLDEPSATIFSMASDGQSLQMSDRYDISGQFTVIDLQAWSNKVTQLMEDFDKSIKNLLPHQISFNDFQHKEITDNHLPHAPHKQPQNACWVKEPQECLRRRLFSLFSNEGGKEGLFENDSTSRANAEEWLRKEQKSLAILAAIFVMACGVPARGWQPTGLQFDSEDALNKTRNTFIIWNSQKLPVVLIGNPRSKQKHRDRAPTLFTFPPSMSQALMYYLYVIRPIGLSVLGSIGSNIPPYSHEIWVQTDLKRRQIEPMRWTSGDISKAIQRLTSEDLRFTLSPLIGRQVVSAVFREKFPSMFENFFRMPAPHISQELARYGQDSGIPKLKYVDEEAAGLLAVNEVWQAAMGVGPLNYAWSELVLGSYLFPTSIHNNLAIWTTRNTIISGYGLVSGSVDLPTQVRTILQKRPFFFEDMQNVDDPSELSKLALGDSILRTVTSTVLFGQGAVRLGATPPIGGVNIDDVLTSILYIIHALQEWSTGKYIEQLRLPRLDDFSALRNELKQFKDVKSKSWIQFSSDVFSQATCLTVPPTAAVTRKLLDLDYVARNTAR